MKTTPHPHQRTEELMTTDPAQNYADTRNAIAAKSLQAVGRHVDHNGQPTSTNSQPPAAAMTHHNPLHHAIALAGGDVAAVIDSRAFADRLSQVADTADAAEVRAAIDDTLAAFPHLAATAMPTMKRNPAQGASSAPVPTQGAETPLQRIRQQAVQHYDGMTTNHTNRTI
jgi:hypothetical protein